MSGRRFFSPDDDRELVDREELVVRRARRSRRATRDRAARRRLVERRRPARRTSSSSWKPRWSSITDGDVAVSASSHTRCDGLGGSSGLIRATAARSRSTSTTSAQTVALRRRARPARAPARGRDPQPRPAHSHVERRLLDQRRPRARVRAGHGHRRDIASAIGSITSSDPSCPGTRISPEMSFGSSASRMLSQRTRSVTARPAHARRIGAIARTLAMASRGGTLRASVRCRAG